MLHGFRVQGVERDQHMIVARAESTHPVLRAARASVTQILRTLRRALDERIEGPVRKAGEAILYFQRYQPRPRNAHVEAVIGLPPGRRLAVVFRARHRDMPLLGRGDLRCVVFVTAGQPPEKNACRCRRVHLQQKMSHHWHAIHAQDEALNLAQIQFAHTETSSFSLHRGVSRPTVP
jgi:hypothetical protein